MFIIALFQILLEHVIEHSTNLTTVFCDLFSVQFMIVSIDYSSLERTKHYHNHCLITPRWWPSMQWIVSTARDSVSSSQVCSRSCSLLLSPPPPPLSSRYVWSSTTTPVFPVGSVSALAVRCFPSISL